MTGSYRSGGAGRDRARTAAIGLSLQGWDRFTGERYRSRAGEDHVKAACYRSRLSVPQGSLAETDSR